MALSSPLNVFRSLRGQGSDNARDKFAKQWGPRPDGPVIWVRCGRGSHVEPALKVASLFCEDGDVGHFVLTLPSDAPPSDDAISLDGGDKAQARAFVQHWRPDVLLWIGSGIEPQALFATDDGPTARILADLEKDGPQVRGSWRPGLTGAMLNRFDHIITVDQDAQGRVERAFPQVAMRAEPLGPLHDGAVVLVANDAERSDIALALGNRPIWCVSGLTTAELSMVARAHRKASRRSHRLLLVAIPKNAADAVEIVQRFRDLSFQTQTRTEVAAPGDHTQVFVADVSGEEGLWYRLSTISYVGGSLTAGNCDDPFSMAALGSVVVHGQLTGPHEAKFTRLARAGGSAPVYSAEELGPAIESLLSPDVAAKISHRAWDVTSSGAEATNRLVHWLHEAIDTAGY